MRLAKTAIYLFGAASSVSSTAAYAQLRAPVIDVNREFGIAAQGFLQSYSESAVFRPGGGTADSEKGIVPGFELKGTTMFDVFGVKHLYLGLEYQYDSGGVHYNGALLNGTPHQGTTDYNVNDVGLEFGKGFLLSDRLMVIPIVEGGWRDWRRQLSSTQVEDYHHYYVGGGLRGDLAVMDRLVLRGKVAVAETLGPAMTADAAGLPNMRFNLGSAPLYQADAGADYRLTTYLHLYGGVDYTHFSYGESAINVFGFLEPPSVTNEIVFRLGIAVGL